MASFQAKTGWKRPRRIENKNYLFVPSLCDAKQKIPKKIAKKFQQLKNIIIDSFQAKNRLEKEEKEIK